MSKKRKVSPPACYALALRRLSTKAMRSRAPKPNSKIVGVSGTKVRPLMVATNMRIISFGDDEIALFMLWKVAVSNGIGTHHRRLVGRLSVPGLA